MNTKLQTNDLYKYQYICYLAINYIIEDKCIYLYFFSSVFNDELKKNSKLKIYFYSSSDNLSPMT